MVAEVLLQVTPALRAPLLPFLELGLEVRVSFEPNGTVCPISPVFLEVQQAERVLFLPNGHQACRCACPLERSTLGHTTDLVRI